MPTYVRVKDPETGHEFDMPVNHPHIAKGLVQIVKPKVYPPSAFMRRPKHHIRLASPSATREQEPSPEVSDTPPADKEN